MIALLDNLYESGQLQMLIDAGIVDQHLAKWRDVYHSYNAALLRSGSKMQAMQDVADNYGISSKTVEYIRRRLSSPNVS